MTELIIAESTKANLNLELTVEQEGVGGVAGLTPTVAIRRGSDPTSYFDWSDTTFKASGWTTKYQTMTSVERGHYTRALDVADLGASLGDIYSVEYRVNESGIIGDASSRLIVVKSIADIPGDVWDEATSAHITAGTFGVEAITSLSATQAAQLLDIYRVLGLDPTAPLIVSRTARTAGSLGQTIQENVPAVDRVTVTRTS